MTTKLNPAAVLPEGYRLAYRLFLWPVWVDGRWRFLEHVPVVQRWFQPDEELYGDWHDCAFFDELRAGQDWEEL